MKLELTTEQINQILNALAEQPYIQVHELINEIQNQGQAQLNHIQNLESETNMKTQNDLASSITSSNGSN